MPAKNSTKTYVENGYYHVYNRGVDKRLIFQDLQDYRVFLSFLKTYLSLKDETNLRNQLSERSLSPKDRDKVWQIMRMDNYSQTITLLAYCLMPNHFHLFLKQKSSSTINANIGMLRL